MQNKMRGNKKINGNKRKQSRNNKSKSNNRTYIKPDHSIVVKMLSQFEHNNIGSGFFESYSNIKPIHLLQQSSWNHLLDIYESVRVTKINIKVWISGVSFSTPGILSAMLFRDVIPTEPLRTAEQLIVEPGSKRTRPFRTMHFQWKPIEPSDYEFYDHTQFSQMDAAKYGQINYAGAALPDSFSKPLVEYILHYDFKHLVKPELPAGLLKTNRLLTLTNESNLASLNFSQSTVISNEANDTKLCTELNKDTELISHTFSDCKDNHRSSSRSLFSLLNFSSAVTN